ncbi:sentrin-specific protease-like [Xenia sp. Carnegie-2017]|uniref:sentrin-specific protease-like n=1 Tax=Xenia sp. Carnegie-2017 TaxID=2897299 RepID=UPI001F03CAF4|nr:sentrin-specific protease-like [Xenia sp. Carnegie-2017]
MAQTILQRESAECSNKQVNFLREKLASVQILENYCTGYIDGTVEQMEELLEQFQVIDSISFVKADNHSKTRGNKRFSLTAPPVFESKKGDIPIEFFGNRFLIVSNETRHCLHGSAKVNKALGHGASNELLVELSIGRVTRADIITLRPQAMLNNEVVNAYFHMIAEPSKKIVVSVHACNTFFYPKLIKTGHTSLRRWTKKVDLFSLDIVLIPIHLGMHCCLADIPEQQNGCDCEVFACQYAEYVSRRSSFNLTQVSQFTDYI